MDSLECNLYTNTVNNIKEAKKDIVNIRKQIHDNPENSDVLNEKDHVVNENCDPSPQQEAAGLGHKVSKINTQNNDDDDDVCIVSEGCETRMQQTKTIPRRSRRNKQNNISNDSCVSSSSSSGKQRKKSTRGKSNIEENVIVLDEDYPTPVSSSWIGTKQRKLSDDSIIVVDSVENSMDLSNMSDIYEEENEDITIVVKWKQMDIHKFKIRKFQNVSSIFEFFSNKEKVSKDEILLLRGDKEVKPSDTPDSLGFKFIAMLDGDITINRIFYDKNTQKEEQIELHDDDSLTVKVQVKHLKHPVEVTIKKQQKLQILIIKCCELFNCPKNKLSIKFDGEVISPKDTADDLGLEGGECFDVYIQQ